MVQLSGLSDSVGKVTDVESSKYAYWTGTIPECYNTMATNYIIGLINAKLAELDVLADIDEADVINELDLYIVSLEALKLAKDSDADLHRCGSIISTMYKERMFSSISVDDAERSANLDSLIAVFMDSYYQDMEFIYEDQFKKWWYEKIIAYNYNGLTYEVKRNFVDYFGGSSSIGSTTPTNMSEYISNSGMYFLYLFIPSTEIKKYSATIQARYKKEQELYQWILDNTKGLFSPDDVYNKVYRGVILEYKMTPAAKLKQLKESGKEYGDIGLAVTVILAIVSAVLTIILTLIKVIGEVLVAKYDKPADEVMGIPTQEDWGLKDTQNGEKKSNIGLITGAAGLVAFAFYKSNDSKKQKKQ